MKVSYTAKAVGDITCVAETDARSGPPPTRTCRSGPRCSADGTVVIEGVINLWVTEKRADLKAAAS